MEISLNHQIGWIEQRAAAISGIEHLHRRKLIFCIGNSAASQIMKKNNRQIRTKGRCTRADKEVGLITERTREVIRFGRERSRSHLNAALDGERRGVNG